MIQILYLQIVNLKKCREPTALTIYGAGVTKILHDGHRTPNLSNLDVILTANFLSIKYPARVGYKYEISLKTYLLFFLAG